MKFRRSLLGLAGRRRRARRLLRAPRTAQTYKAEYKMSLVVGTAFPWGKGGEIWANLVQGAHPGPHQHQAVPRRLADPGRPDARVQRAAPGRDRHGRRLDHQLVAAGQAAQPVLAALPDARLRGRRRADAGRGRQGDLRRRSTRPAWCRWPGARTATARSPTPSAPIKTPDDLKGLKIRVVGSPHVRRHLHRAGRQPDADELGRCAARARQRRGRRPGEPAVHLHRGQAAHASARSS